MAVETTLLDLDPDSGAWILTTGQYLGIHSSMKGMGLEYKSVIERCVGGGACTSITGRVKRVDMDDGLGDGNCIAGGLHLGKTERP